MNLPLTVVGDQLWKRIGESMDRVELRLRKAVAIKDDYESNPDVEPSEYGDGIRTLPLTRLVRMKLNSFRLKDRVHILDMIDVGLLDESWTAKFPKPLEERLRSLIENPDQ